MTIEDCEKTESVPHFQRKEYAESAFWDARFAEEDSRSSPSSAMKFFDWYGSWEELGVVIEDELRHAHALPPGSRLSDDIYGDRVVVVGHGNSRMGEQMVEGGFRDIHCLDISKVITQKMSAHYAAHDDERLKDSLHFVHKDCTRLFEASSGYGGSTAAIVVEKGTLDALMCDPEIGRTAVPALLRSIQHILRDGSGICFLGSHSGKRRKLIEECGLVVVRRHRCDLSNDALFINVVRTVQGHKVPLGSVLKKDNKETLSVCMKTFKESRTKIAMKRIFRGKVRQNRIQKGDSPFGKFIGLSDSESDTPTGRQNHFFLYVIKKPSTYT